MKKLWVLLSVLLLSACQAVELPDFKLSALEVESQTNLKTSKVTVLSNIHYDVKAPFIEYKMLITPEQALKQWAQNKFVAVKPDSPVETYIIIEKASMSETQSISEKWYVLDNVKYRLDFQIAIRFMMGQKLLSERTIGGYESRSLPIKSSLADKEEAWADMMNEMIEKLDNKIKTDLPSYFVEQSTSTPEQNRSPFPF